MKLNSKDSQSITEENVEEEWHIKQLAECLYDTQSDKHLIF